LIHKEGYTTYKVIKESFPLNKGDYELCSYHVKRVLVEKYVLNIKVSTYWHERHINGEFGWIRKDTLDKYYMKYKVLPYKLENLLDEKYFKEFDDYHRDRLSKQREILIDNLLF
jgi:hypothetical protein